MLRRMVICLIIVGAGAPFTASARERRHIDVTPFSHAPCSVLSGECTPSTCTVFNHGRCIPAFYYPYYPYYPYGENLQVTIQSQPLQDDATKYQSPITISIPSAICSRRSVPAGRRRRRMLHVRACRCRCCLVSINPAR
jgi:hypothetical protein